MWSLYKYLPDSSYSKEDQADDETLSCNIAGGHHLHTPGEY